MKKKKTYLDMNIEVPIGCKKCQKYFFCTPDNHLLGDGCPDCYPNPNGKQVPSIDKRRIWSPELNDFVQTIDQPNQRKDQ